MPAGRGRRDDWTGRRFGAYAQPFGPQPSLSRLPPLPRVSLLQSGELGVPDSPYYLRKLSVKIGIIAVEFKNLKLVYLTGVLHLGVPVR